MSSFKLKFDDQSCVDLHVLASWEPVKFVFSKKATKNDEIFTVDLTLTT